MLNVRLAKAEDEEAALGLVCGLLAEIEATPPSPGEISPVFADLVSGRDSRFVVIGEVEGQVRAVCTVSFVQSMRSIGRYAIIQEMYVEPELRSSGAGTDVLRFVLGQAVSAGCSMVELGTPFHGAAKSNSTSGLASQMWVRGSAGDPRGANTQRTAS